ncbi:unnamed protein product, partial [Meganyctiphanes norvegica]
YRNKINKVFMGIDAQIILQWLLSDNVKNRKVYTRNRILDVHTMREQIEVKYGVKVLYKYISTEANPGDMVTRGLSLGFFKRKLSFWLKGPEWLEGSQVIWPVYQLDCLSDENKSLVLCTEAERVNIQPLVSFERFSHWKRLLNATEFTVKAIAG